MRCSDAATKQSDFSYPTALQAPLRPGRDPPLIRPGHLPPTERVMTDKPIFFRRTDLRQLSHADLITEWMILPSGSGAAHYFMAVVTEMRRRGLTR